jgi:protein-disulfide isomerase
MEEEKSVNSELEVSDPAALDVREGEGKAGRLIKLLPVAIELVTAIALFMAGFSMGVWYADNGNFTGLVNRANCNTAAAGAQGVASDTPWKDMPAGKYPDTAPAFSQGDPMAKVRVGLVFDLACPFTQKFISQNLDSLLAEKNVRIEIFDMPLPFHQNAIPAAAAARCAGEQGRYLDFINAIVGKDPDPQTLKKISSNLKLNLGKYNACLDQSTMEVKASQRAANLAKMDGTPTEIINGKVLSGFTDYGTLKRLIDEAK